MVVIRSVFIALGSNLGDRHAHLARARAAIAALPATRVHACSSVEETAPLGDLAQPTYLNQMLLVETALEPHTLLRSLQDIETAAGRARHERWGSRTLDLDIVLVEGFTSDDPALVVPHPELANREFWTREIAELRGMLQQAR